MDSTILVGVACTCIIDAYILETENVSKNVLKNAFKTILKNTFKNATA